MSADSFSPASFPRFRDADARALRERERERGYAEGHAEGYRAGAAQALAEARRSEDARAASETERRREVTSAVTALRSAVDALAEHITRVTRATERDVSARAVELSSLIVAEALADADTAAVAALRRALDAQDPRDAQEIRFSAADLQLLSDQDALPDGIRVTADATLLPGDAMVVIADGLVDARIAAALERARIAAGETS